MITRTTLINSLNAYHMPYEIEFDAQEWVGTVITTVTIGNVIYVFWGENLTDLYTWDN